MKLNWQLRAFLAGSLACGACGIGVAQTFTGASIDAKSNIFGAGQSTPPPDLTRWDMPSLLPPEFDLNPGTNRVRIPTESGHGFQSKADKDSKRIRTTIPTESGQRGKTLASSSS